MENNNLILGRDHQLSLGQNRLLGLESDHSLGLRLKHDLDLGHANHELDSQQARDHEFAILQARGEKYVQSPKHDMSLQHPHEHIQDHQSEFDYEDENGLEIGQHHDHNNIDHDQKIDDDHDHEQSVAIQNHLQLADNHELAIAGHNDFDETMELSVDQNDELGIVPVPDTTFNQLQLINSPPVLQSRALVPSPNLELTVGQEFPNVHSCRRALRNTAIALRFEIQTVKSDKTRFTAKCASEGCSWRIHCAKLPGVPTFTIRTIHEKHTCGGITHLGHQQASVDWVANSVEQSLRENPHYKPKEILEEIHRVHGIALSYKQAWRGKERIMAAVRGSFEDEYRLLPQYCDQIRWTNPGSIASVYGNPVDNSFQRLFVSYHASIYGFLNACRPLIGLDRNLLKSKYLGTLLFATGFDGDGALFPLAFGVVDEENDDNWMWFLSELHNLLEMNSENMPKLTILSDKQKGIVDGVEANFPSAFHGFCMHHLSESFRKEFNNTMLVNLLWEAAQSLTDMEFESKLMEIETISQEAAYWIRRIPPRLWATPYFEGTRFGHLTANDVKSLNPWILEASGLPIIQLMECIRRQLMTWFNERREMSMQWTSVLVPSVEMHVSEALERARAFQVLRANEAEFEVISHEETFIVDIRNRRCLCRGWQLYGIPCAHAVAALLSCRQNVHRFAEMFFTVTNYRRAYSETIHPIPDRTHWKEMSQSYNNNNENANGNGQIEIVITPPKSLKPPGRPRKKRTRTEDNGRVKRIVHCSRCNQTGHFRTTCAAPV